MIERESLLVFAGGGVSYLIGLKPSVKTQMEFVLVSRNRSRSKRKSSKSESGPCVKGCGRPFE